jgi:hypothetical protein
MLASPWSGEEANDVVPAKDEYNLRRSERFKKGRWRDINSCLLLPAHSDRHLNPLLPLPNVSACVALLWRRCCALDEEDLIRRIWTIRGTYVIEHLAKPPDKNLADGHMAARRGNGRFVISRLDLPASANSIDLLPNVPPFISRVCSGFGPCWGGLQIRSV